MFDFFLYIWFNSSYAIEIYFDLIYITHAQQNVDVFLWVFVKISFVYVEIEKGIIYFLFFNKLRFFVGGV
jgi:hypothetical protein